MGRLIVFLLLILAVWIVWKAFGPSSWKSRQQQPAQQQAIKGPDDDEAFLWELEKQRFKQRREAERLAERRANEHQPNKAAEPNPQSKQEPTPGPSAQKQPKPADPAGETPEDDGNSPGTQPGTPSE